MQRSGHIYCWVVHSMKIYRAISRGEEKYTVKQDTNEVAYTTRLRFVPLLCKMV